MDIFPCSTIIRKEKSLPFLVVLEKHFKYALQFGQLSFYKSLYLGHNILNKVKSLPVFTSLSSCDDNVLLPLTPHCNKPQWLSLINSDLWASPDLRCPQRPNRFLNSPCIWVSVVKVRSPVNFSTCCETQNELVSGKTSLTSRSPKHKHSFFLYSSPKP